jgi:hypothetical protein
MGAGPDGGSGSAVVGGGGFALAAFRSHRHLIICAVRLIEVDTAQ